LNQVDDNARSLFGTPDGSTVEMTTPGRNLTVNITGATKSPGTLGTCFTVTPIACPPGSGAIAVTPDQRPVASFVATPAGPGQPASFDASASTIAYGTIANYHWDFGDGSSQDTPTPTTTHSYAAAGNYTVSLTETDWAGTSVATSPPSTVFTGQTMTRRGGPEAQTTHRVTIPSAPTTPLPSLTPTFKPPPGVPTPKISLLPKVGPPGTVVAVSGSNFPANTAVSLAWQPGIGTAAVATSPAGTFTNRFVLVFPKDQLGDRLMVAQTFGATATFLVVPPSIAPGGHGAELSFLFRR
jgi:PKD repeat protein